MIVFADEHHTLCTVPGVDNSVVVRQTRKAGLFNEDVLARLQRLKREIQVKFRRDGDNHGVPGENITFKSSNADDPIGPVTDNHDGTYTATLVASSTVD